MTIETTTVTADPWKRIEKDAFQVLDLAVAIDALRHTERYLTSGHDALILWKTSLIQVMLVGLDTGGALAEHSPPGAASVHLLDGEIRVTLSGEVIYLKAGEMMTLSDMTSHSVEAVHPSAILVTIGPN